MKKLNLIILSLCLLIALTVKSQTTTVCIPSKSTVVMKIDSMAAWVGQQHNNGLDAIYDSIYVNDNYFYSLDMQNRLNIMTQYCVNYAKNLNSKINIDTTTIVSKAVLSNLEAFLNSHNNNDSLFLLTIVDSLNQAAALSTPAKNCLIQLNTILNNATNVSNAISLINELINETENGFKKTSGFSKQGELFVVLSTLYIGEYSISYWYNNQTKWTNLVSLLQQNNNRMHPMAQQQGKGGISWGTVGKLDGAGALVGGVAAGTGALVANLVPGAGQVAYGAAIIGGIVSGAINTSGVAAIGKIFGLW